MGRANYCHLIFRVNVDTFMVILLVLAFNQLAVQTHPSYLTVNWQLPAEAPSSWDILYKLLGTNYHSSLSVAGSETSVNITTKEYPGVLFSIELYTNTNGSRSLSGRGFTRAGKI